jgi:hypothetical protein
MATSVLVVLAACRASSTPACASLAIPEHFRYRRSREHRPKCQRPSTPCASWQRTSTTAPPYFTHALLAADARNASYPPGDFSHAATARSTRVTHLPPVLRSAPPTFSHIYGPLARSPGLCVPFLARSCRCTRRRSNKGNCPWLLHRGGSLSYVLSLAVAPLCATREVTREADD